MEAERRPMPNKKRRHKKRKQPQQIAVCHRAVLFCGECQRQVNAQCITQEWHDHLMKSKVYRPKGDYKRKFVCLDCGAWVGCVKGTYEPLSDLIPSHALRKGWELTSGLVYFLNQEFGFKRDKLAQAMGFETYKGIRGCKDLEKLRDGYRFGIKIRDEARKRLSV